MFRQMPCRAKSLCDVIYYLVAQLALEPSFMQEKTVFLLFYRLLCAPTAPA